MDNNEKNNTEPFPLGEARLPDGHGLEMGQLIERLNQDFSLAKDSLPAVDNLPVIREHLISKVTELMNKDYNRFINNLYRIDIDEVKVLDVLNMRDKTLVSEKLADLIIERQLLRVKTQQLYKEGKL